jgi:hypothetical protein
MLPQCARISRVGCGQGFIAPGNLAAARRSRGGSSPGSRDGGFRTVAAVRDRNAIEGFIPARSWWRQSRRFGAACE